MFYFVLKYLNKFLVKSADNNYLEKYRKTKEKSVQFNLLSINYSLPPLNKKS